MEHLEQEHLKVVGLQQGPNALRHVLVNQEGGVQPGVTPKKINHSGERNALSAQVRYIDILKFINSGRQIIL